MKIRVFVIGGARARPDIVFTRDYQVSHQAETPTADTLVAAFDRCREQILSALEEDLGRCYRKVWMQTLAQPSHVEPRWPVVPAILGVVFVLTLLPARVRLLPFWTPYAVGIALLVPIAGVWLSGGAARWLRIERATTLVLSVFAEGVTFTTLLYLIVAMRNRPEDFSGRQLLTSSAGAWITSVLVFALVDWRIDQGGPESRASDAGRRPDWLFPQTGVPESVMPEWRPTFVGERWTSVGRCFLQSSANPFSYVTPDAFERYYIDEWWTWRRDLRRSAPLPFQD
jgi:hypothetical protein